MDAIDWSTTEMPPLPQPCLDMVGKVVYWQDPANFDVENPEADIKPTLALCIGARWVRDVDGRYHPESSLVQYFMDRGDGSMRWTVPEFPMPQPAQG